MKFTSSLILLSSAIGLVFPCCDAGGSSTPPLSPSCDIESIICDGTSTVQSEGFYHFTQPFELNLLINASADQLESSRSNPSYGIFSSRMGMKRTSLGYYTDITGSDNNFIEPQFCQEDDWNDCVYQGSEHIGNPEPRELMNLPSNTDFYVTLAYNETSFKVYVDDVLVDEVATESGGSLDHEINFCASRGGGDLMFTGTVQIVSFIGERDCPVVPSEAPIPPASTPDVMESFSKTPGQQYGWYRGPSTTDWGIGYCNNRIKDEATETMTLEECARACLDCNEIGECGPTEESSLRPQGLTFHECTSFERNDNGRCFIFPSDASERDGCFWEIHSGSLDYYELIPTANPTTANPTTANPTTANPTTANPTTANPTTANPTTANPTTANPTTANPTVNPTVNPTLNPTCDFDPDEFDCDISTPNPSPTECEYDFGSNFEMKIKFRAAPDQELTYTDGVGHVQTQLFVARKTPYDGMIGLFWDPRVNKIGCQFFHTYLNTGIDGNNLYPVNESLETGQEYVVSVSFIDNRFSWEIDGYGLMQSEVIPAEETPHFEPVSFCLGGGGGRRDFTGSVAITNFQGACNCPDEMESFSNAAKIFASTTAVSAGAHGDPHLVTWSGEKYDFHGICDLVLLSNPEFKGNKGLDIHIRTKRIHQFSYIESSAIRIGNDIIEVTGGKNNMNKVRINGLIHEMINTDDKEESLEILGYDVRFKRMGDKAQQFVIDLGGGFDESIIFRTWNSFVSIKVQNPTANNFGSSIGLMGSFPSGKKIARDNKTVVNDVNVFGQEWQVNGDEAKLFHEAKGPQFPQKCEIPSSHDMRRRLADSDITMKRAEDICSNVKEYKEMCIFDVMVTNDLTIVGAY